MARVARAVLGGTFDRLHVGHEALLASAFRTGRTVAIGVTTEGFLARHPKPGAAAIQPYAARRRALTRWLSARFPAWRWTLTPLDDPFGRSVGPGVDALVVSADTRSGAQAVLAERRRRGFPPVPVRVVPLVLGDDLQPVSSRRIRAGEIDPAGRRRAPIGVGLAVDDPEDLAPARAAIRAAFPHARIVPVPYPKRGRASARLGSAARRAAAAGDLGVAVRRVSPTRRLLIERAGAIGLVPRGVPRRSPAQFAAALTRLLAPGRSTQRI
ncbi:MAG: pantetheine-phosphate adenylyltransferase [Thermoplasmata archaeon]